MNPIRRVLGVLKMPDPVPLWTERVDLIITKMTGNVYFQNVPNIAQILAAAQAANGKLKLAQIGAKNKTVGAAEARTAELKDTKPLVEGLLQIVQQTADADPAHAVAIIESAGMFARIVTMPAIPDFSAKQGAASGEVVTRVKSRGHGTTYWFASSSDGKTWVVAPASRKATFVFTGLPAGATSWFRFQTLTKKGLSDWSQPISLLVH
jgi:hypothetical protein